MQKIGTEDAADDELAPTKKLSQEDKHKILKERRLARRKNKEATASAAAADQPEESSEV